MSSHDDRVRDFYAALRYPGPDALITTVWAERLRPVLGDAPFRFLDAGCGSGRHAAGLLKTFPGARGVGFDVSEPSLDEARALADATGAGERVEFARASFLEPLPFEPGFDVALVAGTIHHCTDPTGALRNIAATIRPGGYVAGMVYSARSSRRRYEIKEMLAMLSRDGSLDELRALYAAYAARYESILDRTPRETARRLRKTASRWRHWLMGRSHRFGYLRGAATGDAFLADAFASPVDRAFESTELRAMFDAAGLSLERMYGLGRPDPGLLPAAWRDRWESLDLWDKVRLSELVDPVPTSFSFLTVKN